MVMDVLLDRGLSSDSGGISFRTVSKAGGFRTPYRALSIDVFFSKYAPVRGGNRSLLHRHIVSRTTQGRTLATARMGNPAARIRPASPQRRTSFRTIDLLPRLCRRFLPALRGAGFAEWNCHPFAI